jgi:4-oxalocrotonate tautomerase family enzyme
MWTGRTESQKRELARAITDAMVSIGQTTADATIIIFEDIDKENWAEGGHLASEEEE